MQQGKHLAENIFSFLAGKALKPFQFVDRGEMLSMGVRGATITGLGITISGLIAFQMRRMAYLSKFPNFSLGIRSFGAWLINHRKNSNDPYLSKDLSILKYSIPNFIKNNSELMERILKIDESAVTSPTKGSFEIELKKNE